MIISKISKGTAMDQIYIPKKRAGFPTGSYVVINQLETEPEKDIKLFYYNIRYLEPVKVGIIKEIFKGIDKHLKSDNTIITGSFLDEGFRFNDIDVLIVSEEKQNINYIAEELKRKMGINVHLILISNKALIKGLSTDPLYSVMLSRCVSKKRVVYGVKPKINYKMIDLHILKSRLLIDNFDVLTGAEKYELVRNLIAIDQFVSKKEVSREGIDSAINSLFGRKAVERLKDNMISKKDFLHKYRRIYISLRNKVFRGIRDESKQK